MRACLRCGLHANRNACRIQMSNDQRHWMVHHQSQPAEPSQPPLIATASDQISVLFCINFIMRQHCEKKLCHVCFNCDCFKSNAVS